MMMQTAHAYSPAARIGAKLRRRWTRLVAKRERLVDLDHGVVTFTFDDFPKSAADFGARALEKRGWRGTYYASAVYAGGQNHHGALFDAGDIQRLEAAGHEIGCHTYGHLDCAGAPVERALADVRCNARALKAMGLEGEITSFAYPYGEAQPAAKRALSNWFDTLRGIEAGVNRGRTDFNQLKSTPLDGGQAGIERAVEAAGSLVAHPGWLIFYAHDICDEPSEWGCTPDQFEQVLEAVKASGAEVLTMREAARRMGAPA